MVLKLWKTPLLPALGLTVALWLVTSCADCCCFSACGLGSSTLAAAELCNGVMLCARRAVSGDTTAEVGADMLPIGCKQGLGVSNPKQGEGKAVCLAASGVDNACSEASMDNAPAAAGAGRHTSCTCMTGINCDTCIGDCDEGGVCSCGGSGTSAGKCSKGG